MHEAGWLVSTTHSGMENYNESSCHGPTNLPELKTKCERYATEVFRHGSLTTPLRLQNSAAIDSGQTGHPKKKKREREMPPTYTGSCLQEKGCQTFSLPHCICNTSIVEE